MDLWKAKELRKKPRQDEPVGQLDTLPAPKPIEMKVPERVMLQPVMLPAEEKEAPQESVTLPDVTLQSGETDEFLEFKRRLRLANRDRVRKHRAKKAAEKKNEPSS